MLGCVYIWQWDLTQVALNGLMFTTSIHTITVGNSGPVCMTCTLNNKLRVAIGKSVMWYTGIDDVARVSRYGGVCEGY